MEKFYFFRSFLDTARAIKDDKLRAEYLMAVAEYGLEGKEANDPMVKALMVQTQFVLDRSQELSQLKSECMKGNQNAAKNWQKQGKQRKTVKNSEKQKKQEEEVEEEVEERNIKIISSKEEIEQGSLSREITNLINEIKQQCDNLGVAYDKQKERYFAKFILTAKEFGNFCEKIGQDRVTFALNVLKVSAMIGYRKGVCAGPMKIYQNYAEVYNKAVEERNKQSKNLIQSF